MSARRGCSGRLIFSRRGLIRASLLTFGPILVSACVHLSSVKRPTNIGSTEPPPALAPAASAVSSGSGTSAPSVVQAFLDPGHGGVDTGTVGVAEDGTIVEEKAVTLAVAKRTAALLQAAGISVGLSRTGDSLPGAVPGDYTADGSELTPDGVLADLQRRIDRANASGARVLLSIHFNTFDDPSVAGAETFYDASRSFASQNERFATLVQSNLIAMLYGNGYDTPDRGITSDANLYTDTMDSLGNYNHLVLLGPGISGQLTPSKMPGALCEALFLSNSSEATAALDSAVQDLIAKGFAQAIQQFLATVQRAPP